MAEHDGPSCEHHILTERRGCVGLITLNRPQALNALSKGMLTSIDKALSSWQNDDDIGCVVIQSVSDRAFCAGGDIRSVAEAARRAKLDGGTLPTDYFRLEYRLNHRIKTYPKPYVALINGIVMGGGVGISIHGRYRVVADDVRFAMPEVGIGFFPDVGATFFLPRLPDQAGAFLGLTGLAVGWRDCIELGLATHVAPRSTFGAIIQELREGRDPEAVLSQIGPVAEDGQFGLPPARERRAVFAAGTIQDVLIALQTRAAKGEEWADAALSAIQKGSPTSVKLAFQQIKRGGRLDFAQAMRTEFRIVSRLLLDHDFYEGVRALIIDKDKSPKWMPDRLDQVPDEMIEACFSPVERELDLS